jgi:PKD repeat protein
MDFINESVGTPLLTYLWDFGDGIGTSTEKDPSYTYAAVGTYMVMLTTTNAYGSDTVTHQVEVLPPPCADITSVEVTVQTPAPIYPGDMVEFNVDITPNGATAPYTYTVDFGDGNTFEDISSADPLVLTHTFATVGDFTVDVGALNCAMTAPVTDSVSLTVVEAPVPLTSVELSLDTPGTIEVGEMADFSADLLPDDADKPYTYTIDFGDGTAALTDQSSDDPLPFTHTFAITGTFMVIIEAWNASNTEPVTDSLEVTIYEPGSVFYTFLPFVAKNGTPQGVMNQMQKGLADQPAGAASLPLPLLFSAPMLFSAMFILPVFKKLR